MNEDIFMLPIKVLLDDYYKEFIPFVPVNAVLQYGTGKTAEELFAERYTKDEVDKIIEELGTLLRLAGICNSRSELPKTAKPGDVWIVKEAANATEVVWLNDGWEDLGPLIDLTPYALISDVKKWIADNASSDQAYADTKTSAALKESKDYTDTSIETFKNELSEYVKSIPVARVEEIVKGVLG